MNLIEQLGGYEAAKAKIGQINHTLENSELLGGGDAREGLYERLESIDKALLEYRRQHNIFEAGDKVVFEAHFCDEHKGSGYGEITYCTMDKRVFEIDNYYLVSIDEIRHATDAEIKAGKRLGVMK